MKTSKKLNILDVLIVIIIVVVGSVMQPLSVHARALHDDGPISSSAQPGPLDLESVDLISQNGYIEQIGQMGDLMDVTAVAVGDDNRVYFADGTTLKIAVMSTVNRLEELGSLTNLPGAISEIQVANGYAFLLVVNQGLWAIDISNPAAPIIISSLPLTDARRLAIEGDYAYVLSSNTFATLDISDVTTLKHVATISLYNNDSKTLLLDKTYAYLTTYNGLAIVDLSNPRTPRRVGGITLENTSTTSLVVAEDMAYLATWYGKIYVVDIANRTQPVLVTSVQEEKMRNSQYTLAFLGSHLYLIGGTLFATYDIATPDSPTILQKQTLPWELGQSLRQAVVGNQYIFLAEGYLGLSIYDIHSPATPTQVRSNLAGDLAGLSGIANLDHWLYLANDGELEIYNSTDPLSLKLISRIVVPGYASDLWRAEDRLYLKVTPGSKLLIYDLAVPNRPSLIGEVALPLDLRELTVRRNAVYGITWTTTNNLLTFDTTIASAPVQLSTIELSWDIDTLSTGSNYLFASGAKYIDSVPRGTMSIFDIAKNVKPSSLGNYTSPMTNTYFIRTVTTVDAYAYFSTSGGVEIVNIANPSVPTYIGTPQVGSLGLPFGRNIFISSFYSGFSLVDIEDPLQPVVIDTISVPSDGFDVVGDFPNIFYASPLGIRVFRYSSPENTEVPTSGASWTTSDEVKYSFPSNTYTQSLPIEHILHYAQALDLPPSLINLGHFFELRPRTILTETTTPFSITVPYDNLRLSDDSYSVGLYRLTENGWSMEETNLVDSQTGVVSIATNRFDSWALLAEQRPVSLTWNIYLPLTLRPAPDLHIRNIELTQAIQNPENSVALVENRPTLARVFAEVSGTEPVDGIRIAVSGYRNGSPLPGSPIQVGPLSVYPKPLRSNLGDSFNVLLPQGWLSGEIDLEIVVDTANVLSESDESNNDYFQHVAFTSIPPLDVMIVPVNLTNLLNGLTCKWSPEDFISDRVMRTFPVNKVNIQYHAPISVSIKGTEPEPLTVVFQAVHSVKQSEELPYGVVYYGVVLGAVNNENGYQNCLTSYFRYIGFGGGRVGVSFDMTPWPGEPSSSDHVAAHELGHALGRPHTFQDLNYPYPDDSIGQYGIDIGLMQLHSPILPGNAKDFMSYQPSDWAWVSDYMYVGMLNDQIRYGVTNRIGVANNRVIMLRATLLDSEHASIQPIYVFTGTNKLGYEERGDYSAEVFDQDDKLIGVYPLDLVQVYGESEDLFTLGANLSFTSSTLSKVRIKLKDEVIGERKITNQVATGGLEIQKTVQDLVLTWDQPELPAMVQYSNDDGSTWVTLGVDVYGGVFHVDPTDLSGGKIDFRLTLADLMSPTSWIATFDQSLPNTTPQVWVTGPSVLKADQPLLLFGHGADREDGIIENISWSIDGELISADQILQISSLSPGQHVITATVQDKDGVRSTATHTITVESGSVFDSRSEQ